MTSCATAWCDVMVSSWRGVMACLACLTSPHTTQLTAVMVVRAGAPYRLRVLGHAHWTDLATYAVLLLLLSFKERKERKKDKCWKASSV